MRRLGDLEAIVMDSLWSRHAPATVRQVLTDVNTSDRSLAYTTVMTVLENLYRKGFLTRERAGRAWTYTAAQTRAEHTAAVMRAALADSADREGALLHFVETISASELQQLRAALRDDGAGATLPRPGQRDR